MEEAAQLQAFGESNSGPWWMAMGLLWPPPLLTYRPLQTYHTLKPQTSIQISFIKVQKCYHLSPPAPLQHIPLHNFCFLEWFLFVVCLSFSCFHSPLFCFFLVFLKSYAQREAFSLFLSLSLCHPLNAKNLEGEVDTCELDFCSVITDVFMIPQRLQLPACSSELTGVQSHCLL